MTYDAWKLATPPGYEEDGDVDRYGDGAGCRPAALCQEGSIPSVPTKLSDEEFYARLARVLARSDGRRG